MVMNTALVSEPSLVDLGKCVLVNLLGEYLCGIGKTWFFMHFDVRKSLSFEHANLCSWYYT